MIPKIIHYCWFGGKPLPKDVLDCIKTWKKYCPDYEIKRWDESNFDVNSHPFMKAAYEAKAWAFVSDYARLKVVYDNGGIYFVGPAIYIASPGPIFFAQERVGRNGRKFKMYKFRSMYMDAEERKKELAAQNKVGDGMMFKMDFDPRIIGNKVLPNGKKKTGIGQFIRKTSLDEFPQFFNILVGDMSLVGTRPPTLDEWEKYEPHHRARMSFRPGLTGLWQVSGRSNITDFEEVVKLDTQYIREWSVKNDLRIIFKTVVSIMQSDGAI